MEKIEFMPLDEVLAMEEAELAVDGLEEEWDDFGIVYESGEELCCGSKEFERDRHRWELDPASAEDYVDRARNFPLSQRWRHFGH